MNAHIADEQIVEYLDGTLTTATERTIDSHLGTCDDCRGRLADLAQFDSFVQSHQPGCEVTTAAMFEVSERVLAARRPGFRWGGFVTMLAAALLLVAGSFWMRSGAGAGDLGLRITRYVPDGALRSAPPERFHLDLQLGETAFVAALARFADGKVTLLPTGPAALLPRGAVRVPANELLDWEYPADGMPREVLVVVDGAAPNAAELAALASAWAASGPGEVPKMATSAGRRAQLLPFPLRQ